MEPAGARKERDGQVQAYAVAECVEDVEVEDADCALGRMTPRPGGVIALISDEELVCVGVLIGKLNLPVSGGEIGLVLQAQTGLCKSYRLSTLAGGRPRTHEKSRSQNNQSKDSPRGFDAPSGHDQHPPFESRRVEHIGVSGPPF